MNNMWRRQHTLPVFCAFLALAVLPASAQSFQANIGTIPESDGAELRGGATVIWTPALSSHVTVLSDSDSSKDEIAGFAGSLIASTTRTLEIALSAIEYGMRGGGGRFKVGIGGRYYREAVDEDGVFELDAANQQFDNDYALTLIGPDISASLSRATGPLAIRLDASLSPISFYSLQQSISITPLVATDGSTGDSGTATLYADLSARVQFFGVVRGSVRLRSVGFHTNLLGLAYDGTTYSFTNNSRSVRNNELTLLGSARISVQDVGSLDIGGGYRWSISVDTEDPSAEPTSIGERVISFSLSI